jgi:hypothetical protein
VNILISTTTNWNSGDDIIRLGVKNILKHIFPFTPNYIHYDRNPNNMVKWPDDQNMKFNLHGTFMNSPIDWKKIDLVVLAGSPEFLHHPLAPIYEGLVDHSEIPLWAIGVGYTEPYFVLPFTYAEKEVLKRNGTLIIARQEELANRMNLLLNPQQIHCQPCPALFCFEKFPEKKRYGSYAKHSLEELFAVQDWEQPPFFSSDYNDMLEYIGSCENVISDRLHGAIAGISAGASVSLTNDSFRCQAAIKLFEEVIESDAATITTFKTRILNNYINIIKPYYDKSFTA